MADPTRTELETQLKNLSRGWEQTRLFGEENSDVGPPIVTNLIALLDTITQNAEGDNAGSMVAAATALRRSLAAVLQGWAAPLDIHLLDWGKFLNTPERDPQAILTEMFRDFDTNTRTVLSRDFTYGAITPDGGNVGNATIVRLTVDEFGYDIENVTAEIKTMTVIRDQTSGAQKNREVYRFEGQTASPDDLESIGSGAVAEFTSIDPPLDSLLLNAGFDGIAGTEALPTDIPGWVSNVAVIGDGTDYEFIPSTGSPGIYLPKPTDASVRRSLKIKLARILTQKLSARRTQLASAGALFLRLPYHENGNATGTLEITLGGAPPATVTLVAGAAWKLLTLPLDINSWYANFTEDDLDIKIDFQRTLGELSIDDVFFVGLRAFDGGIPYLAVPGRTPAILDDKHTATDTAVESIIQRSVYRLKGRYLPHSLTPTIAEPV